MPAAKQLDGPNDVERVVEWRRLKLERAGYEPEAAGEIAKRLDVDLHRAIDLLGSGCPEETAVRILL